MHTEHSQPCVFENVLDRVPTGTIQKSDPVNERLAKIEEAPLQGSAWCLAHQQLCPIKCSNLDVSGLPCTDNSAANHHRLFDAGDTAVIFKTWAKEHLTKETELLILENVEALRCQQAR